MSLGAGPVSSGVLGGLPKPNPTGLPKLPGLVPPKPPNAVGLLGEEPKANDGEDFSGVEKDAPPNTLLAVDDIALSFSVAFSSSSVLSGCPKRLLLNTEGAPDPNGFDFETIDLFESPDAKALVGGEEVDVDDRPNVKEDLAGAVPEALSDVNGVNDPNPGAPALLSEGASSSLGMNPPLPESDALERFPNPEKAVGGAGIAALDFGCESDGAKDLLPKARETAGL